MLKINILSTVISALVVCVVVSNFPAIECDSNSVRMHLRSDVSEPFDPEGEPYFVYRPELSTRNMVRLQAKTKSSINSDTIQKLRVLLKQRLMSELKSYLMKNNIRKTPTAKLEEWQLDEVAYQLYTMFKETSTEVLRNNNVASLPEALYRTSLYELAQELGPLKPFIHSALPIILVNNPNFSVQVIQEFNQIIVSKTTSSKRSEQNIYSYIQNDSPQYPPQYPPKNIQNDSPQYPPQYPPKYAQNDFPQYPSQYPSSYNSPNSEQLLLTQKSQQQQLESLQQQVQTQQQQLQQKLTTEQQSMKTADDNVLYPNKDAANKQEGENPYDNVLIQNLVSRAVTAVFADISSFAGDGKCSNISVLSNTILSAIEYDKELFYENVKDPYKQKWAIQTIILRVTNTYLPFLSRLIHKYNTGEFSDQYHVQKIEHTVTEALTMALSKTQPEPKALINPFVPSEIPEYEEIDNDEIMPNTTVTLKNDLKAPPVNSTRVSSS